MVAPFDNLGLALLFHNYFTLFEEEEKFFYSLLAFSLLVLDSPLDRCKRSMYD